MSKRDFTVTIHDTSERADMFMEVFGKLTVPVYSFIPEFANLPGFDTPQLVYKLYIPEIAEDALARLISAISRKFGADEAVVAEAIAEHGMAILASDCTVVVENPQKWI